MRLERLLEGQSQDETQISKRKVSFCSFEDEIFYEPQGEVSSLPEIKVVLSRAEEIMNLARNWKPIDLHDDYRAADAAKEGGFILDDPVILQKLRSALKDLIA